MRKWVSLKNGGDFSVKSMSDSSAPKSFEYCMKLNSILDINSVSQFYDRIKSELSNENPHLCFDAADISQMSTPYIQVFLSLFKWLQDHDVKFVIKNPSENFFQSFENFGISREELKSKYLIIENDE